jgi:hypothetical protein
MTELSFLLELLLNHKLPKITKDLISTRIKEVEQELNCTKVAYRTIPDPSTTPDSPFSTTKKTGLNVVEHQVPIDQVAQTPQAAQALASRQQAIQEAISGKIQKGQERPKKW